VLNGSNLELQRVNGRRLWIGSTAEVIPATPPSLAATGLTPGTGYFIYAYMNSGTMTLEASTTAPALNATFGHQVKTGDDTRSLVGWAQPITGPAWVNSEAQRQVASYFNRRDLSLRNNFTANRTTSSSTYVEINTEIRCTFFSWGDDAVVCSLTGTTSINASNGTTGSAVSLDGSSSFGASGDNQVGLGVARIDKAVVVPAPSQGLHYLTLIGRAVDPATATFTGGTAGAENVCTLSANVKG